MQLPYFEAKTFPEGPLDYVGIVSGTSYFITQFNTMQYDTICKART